MFLLTEEYQFKYRSWNKTEKAIIIYMMRNFELENHRLFTQMLSMIEPESSKKIFEEIKNIEKYLPIETLRLGFEGR